jgi:hypothetical protein
MALILGPLGPPRQAGQTSETLSKMADRSPKEQP